MPEEFVPGYTAIGDDDPGDPGNPFNPTGDVFGPYLVAILGKGAATHWTTLTDDATAMEEHHGRGYDLAGYTLTVDAGDDLGAGWRCVVVGPGMIDPTGGDDVVLSTGEWAQVGSDGTATVFIMQSGRLPDSWIPVAVASNEATFDLSDGDRFLLTVDDDCEIQAPTAAKPIPFAVRILISGGPHAITFASGWLGAAPTISAGDGDETVLSGIVLDLDPVTAVLGTVKTLPAA